MADLSEDRCSHTSNRNEQEFDEAADETLSTNFSTAHHQESEVRYTLTL